MKRASTRESDGCIGGLRRAPVGGWTSPGQGQPILVSRPTGSTRCALGRKIGGRRLVKRELLLIRWPNRDAMLVCCQQSRPRLCSASPIDGISSPALPGHGFSGSQRRRVDAGHHRQAWATLWSVWAYTLRGSGGELGMPSQSVALPAAAGIAWHSHQHCGHGSDTSHNASRVHEAAPTASTAMSARRGPVVRLLQEWAGLCPGMSNPHRRSNGVAIHPSDSRVGCSIMTFAVSKMNTRRI